jgi:ABC-2 type transport system permease protein
VTIGASILANALASEAELNPKAAARRVAAVRYVALASPMELYSDATATVIDPTRRSARSAIPGGPLEALSMTRFSGPLPLEQSLLVVMPHIISLLAVTVVCFAVSYAVFMRQEIRSL